MNSACDAAATISSPGVTRSSLTEMAAITPIIDASARPHVDALVSASTTWFDAFSGGDGSHRSWGPAPRAVHEALIASTGVRVDDRLHGESSTRRPSLCHDGTPIVYSHELARLDPGIATAPRFRMLVEPGDLSLDVPLQVDCSLHVLDSIGAALGWRIGAIARSILVEALPADPAAARALWGGVWLGMGASSTEARDGGDDDDGSGGAGDRDDIDDVELRMYVNLRHGDTESRWARARAMARVGGVRDGDALLDELSALIGDCGVPVGVGVAFVRGHLPVLRLYVGVEEPTSGVLMAMTPEAHRRAAAPCIDCVAEMESLAGGFRRQGVTIGYDLRTGDVRPASGSNSGARIEPGIARVKYDVSLQTIACHRRDEVARAFAAWANAHGLDGEGGAAFVEGLAQVFGGAAIEFISLAARPSGVGATIYVRPGRHRSAATLAPSAAQPIASSATTSLATSVTTSLATSTRRRALPDTRVLESCDAAQGFLLRTQSGNGFWRDYSLEPGVSDAWTTSLAGCALAEAGDETVQRAVARAASAVAACRREDGWGYNARTACDADSTAWAIRLLGKASDGGFGADSTAVRSIDALRRHVDGDGNVHTFRGARFGRWADAHDDVAAVVAVALWEAGDRASARCIADALLRAGGGRTFWWTTPAYGWARFLEMVELIGPSGLIGLSGLSGVIECPHDDRSRRHDESPSEAPSSHSERLGQVRACMRAITDELLALPEPRSAFDVAQRLMVATSLVGLTTNRADRLRQLADRLAETLVETQLVDGSWRPSPVLRVPSQHPGAVDLDDEPGHADGARTVSTAAALTALARYRQSRGPGGTPGSGRSAGSDWPVGAEDRRDGRPGPVGFPEPPFTPVLVL